MGLHRSLDLDSELERGGIIELDLPSGERSLLLDLTLEQLGPIAVISYGLEEGRQAYTMPSYSTALSDVPPRSYLVIARRAVPRREYLVLLALSHSYMRSHFVGTTGGLQLRVSGEDEGGVAALISQGPDLHETLESLFAQGLMRTGQIGRLRMQKPPLPPWIERIGWESGLAFGRDVSHEAILETANDFRKRGVELSYVLIDEGWQELADHPAIDSLASFGADPIRFPGGLKGTCLALSEIGITQVGVWHGLMGARGGVHPKLAARYQLPRDGEGHYYLGDHLGHTFQFYFDYYESLKKEGITFIKVGDQGRAPLWGESTRLYRHLQIALQATSSIHFNSAHLNAECLRNENLFYWSTSRIARAGRNLHPSSRHEVYRALRDHISNSAWLHHLMQPDFDTWASSSPYFETMAVFHALATSMNAISDRAGEQRLSLLRRLLLPSGKLLKSDAPLIPTTNSLFHDPLHERVAYTTSTRVADCGIIGAFNLMHEEEVVHGSVSPLDVVGLEGDLFAGYSYRNGFLGPIQREDRLAITVKPRQPDIYTFAPIRDGIAVIGCHLFYLARATVTEVQVEEEAVYLHSLVAGPTLLSCPRDLLEVRRNGDVVGWDQDMETGLLCIDTRNQPIEMECHYTLLFV